jgi:hypothetical protein
MSQHIQNIHTYQEVSLSLCLTLDISKLSTIEVPLIAMTRRCKSLEYTSTSPHTLTRSSIARNNPRALEELEKIRLIPMIWYAVAIRSLEVSQSFKNGCWLMCEHWISEHSNKLLLDRMVLPRCSVSQSGVGSISCNAGIVCTEPRTLLHTVCEVCILFRLRFPSASIVVKPCRSLIEYHKSRRLGGRETEHRFSLNGSISIHLLIDFQVEIVQAFFFPIVTNRILVHK